MSELNLPKELKEEISNTIFRAVTENPWIILTLKRAIVKDGLIEYALTLEPLIFRHIKHPSIPISYKAVELEGTNLRFVPRSHISKRLCEIAVKSNPRALLYVPDKYRDEDMEIQCFDLDPSLLEYFEVDDDYFIQRLDENPSIVRYKKTLDESIICEAIKRDYNIALYFDKLTPKMKKILDEYYPQVVNMLPNYKR